MLRAYGRFLMFGKIPPPSFLKEGRADPIPFPILGDLPRKSRHFGNKTSLFRDHDALFLFAFLIQNHLGADDLNALGAGEAAELIAKLTGS